MVTKTISIEQFGLVIELAKDDKSPDSDWGGAITSKMQGSPLYSSKHEQSQALRFNDMMDALESIILAHACAGINVTTPTYVEGIQTACDACAKATE